MRTIVSIGAQSGSPHWAWKGRFARDRFGTPGQPITSGEEKRGSRFRAPNAGKTRTAPPTRGAVRRVIGFATYLLHVHDAASRREVLRGDVTLDPALDFEESSLWRARVGVKQVSVRVWVRTRVLDQSAWTLEKLGRSGGSTHLAALVLLSLRGGGHLERPPKHHARSRVRSEMRVTTRLLARSEVRGRARALRRKLTVDSLTVWVVIARVSGLRSSSTFHDLLLLDARSSCGVRPETRALGDHAGADARR
jgi:hypothetical protein